MKFIDINREFTAAANSYMAQGYYINAGLSEKTQRKVLDELTRCFDDVSVEDAAQMKF